MRGLETAAADVFSAVPNRAFPKKYVKKELLFLQSDHFISKKQVQKKRQGGSFYCNRSFFLCYILGMHTK